MSVDVNVFTFNAKTRRGLSDEIGRLGNQIKIGKIWLFIFFVHKL